MNIPRQIKDYIRWFEEEEPFIQANYGDGEWACILGEPGQNCNGERYTAEIQKALIDTLKYPPDGIVLYGSHPGTSSLELRARKWLKDNQCTHRSWIFKRIVAGASARGKVQPFIRAVKKRKTLVIGPEYLNCKAIKKSWDINAFISVPEATAFQVLDKTYDKAKKAVNQHKPVIVLVCSGMAANPLIHKLARYTKCNITILDMGAALDPYAGKASRNAHRKPEFQKAMKKNLKGIV